MSDFAELVLWGELMQLQAGRFRTREQRTSIVRAALDSVAVLKRMKGFSAGPDALAALEAKLLALI